MFMIENGPSAGIKLSSWEGILYFCHFPLLNEAPVRKLLSKFENAVPIPDIIYQLDDRVRLEWQSNDYRKIIVLAVNTENVHLIYVNDFYRELEIFNLGD